MTQHDRIGRRHAESCSRHIRYHTWSDAASALAHIRHIEPQPGCRLETYKCLCCAGFHNGNWRRGRQESIRQVRPGSPRFQRDLEQEVL